MQLFRKEAIDHAARRLTGEVVLASPTSLRVLAALAISVGIGVVLFCAISTISQKEAVTGWLVPKGGVVRLTAHAGGIVTEILVKEGEAVGAGHPIAKLRLSSSLTSGEDAGLAVHQAYLSEAGAVRAQASAQRDKLLAEREGLGPKLRDLGSQLSELNGQIRLQQDQLKIARADVKRFQDLLRQGAIAERQVDDRRSAMLGVEQNLSQLRGQVLSVEQQVGEAASRLRAIPADLAAAQATAGSAGAQITERKIQNGALSSELVVSSVAGHVLAIPVAEGQALASGATVAIVSARGGHLEAELYAPSRSAGLIKPGDEVRLMYDAYPYVRFGSALGTVTSISRTILAPSDIAVPGIQISQPVFRVRVALARQSLRADDQDIPLQPGMLLTGNIVLDRRTIFQWIFDPLHDHGRSG
jgi:membrane fusion protein